MEGFSLSKAYLDVVDGAGRCAISYRAQLAWGPFALGWESLSLFEPGRPPVHVSAWMSIPRRRGHADAWPSDNRTVGANTGGERHRPSRLGVHVSWEPWCAPFAARLLDTASGTLDWSCDAAGADVAIGTEDGIEVRGAGYAERLELSILPWTLPIAELRWGRWHCPESRRSIAWIDWRGERPLTLVLENGTAQDRPTVSDEMIAWGGQSLRLASTRALYSRTIAEIVRGARPLVDRLPPSWRALEDRKSLSRGAVGAESGWAVHEMVRFP